MKDILDRILATEVYQKNILYGKPRRGHPEGTIAAHIQELEGNLELLWSRWGYPLNGRYWRLKILIHVHDTFKGVAKRDCPIADPQSHASLARAFLAHFTADQDLLNIVQYHDLGFAMYSKLRDKGHFSLPRLQTALSQIHDLDLYLTFCIIDGCTGGKGREMICWFVDLVGSLYPRVTIKRDDVLPGTEVLAGGVW